MDPDTLQYFVEKILTSKALWKARATECRCVLPT